MNADVRPDGDRCSSGVPFPVSELSESFESYLIWGLALLAGAPIAMAAIRRYERDETAGAIILLLLAGVVVFGCLVGFGQSFQG